MTDDFSVTRKDMMIKKAIRDYAKEHGVGINNYGSISNWELFLYMKEHRMGVIWISKNQIQSVRSSLAQCYREKIKD
jgi:hypothetical protein